MGRKTTSGSTCSLEKGYFKCCFFLPLYSLSLLEEVLIRRVTKCLSWLVCAITACSLQYSRDVHTKAALSFVSPHLLYVSETQLSFLENNTATQTQGGRDSSDTEQESVLERDKSSSKKTALYLITCSAPDSPHVAKKKKMQQSSF